VVRLAAERAVALHACAGTVCTVTSACDLSRHANILGGYVQQRSNNNGSMGTNSQVLVRSDLPSVLGSLRANAASFRRVEVTFEGSIMHTFHFS
jgi:hypothetical protein